MPYLLSIFVAEGGGCEDAFAVDDVSMKKCETLCISEDMLLTVIFCSGWWSL